MPRTMALTVRPATADDVEAIAALLREFQQYLRALGDAAELSFDADAYLRDGFGDDPAFSGFVAASDSGIVGYLLYHFGYDTDRGCRIVHVVDLFVRRDARGQGAGRALMERVAEVGRARGARTLVWSVYAPNALARRFYEGLGADYLRDLEWMTLELE